MIISISLGIVFIVYCWFVWWFTYGSEGKRLDKIRFQKENTAKSIRKITIQTLEKNGRIFDRCLEGQDASNWFQHWVYRNKSVDIDKFKWEFKEIK